MHCEAAVREFELTYSLFLLLVLAGSQREQSRVRAGELKPWTKMQILKQKNITIKCKFQSIF